MSQQRLVALRDQRPALRRRALLAPGVRLRVRDPDRDCRDPPAQMVPSSCNDASPSWKTQSMTRVATAVKVLSLDTDGDYRGRTRGVMVHKVPSVRREDVILPEATLEAARPQRPELRGLAARNCARLGQSTRKGILLYGPPGTGKTHDASAIWRATCPVTPP